MKTSLFVVFIFWSFSNFYSQDLKIGVVEVKSLPKAIFPVVFYQDSLSKEYIEKFMLKNGKFIKSSFCRPTELSENFNMLTFFTFFKESVNEVNSPDQTSPMIEIFLTDGMNKIDSIQLFNSNHANLVFDKTLDKCFSNFQRIDYDKIVFSVSSIQDTYSPRYFEIVK